MWGISLCRNSCTDVEPFHQITTHEHHLHIAAADGAPGFETLAQDIAKDFILSDVPLVPVVMDDYNADWDSLYPFSAVSSFFVCLFSNSHLTHLPVLDTL